MQFLITGQRMTLQQATETATPEAFCNAQFVFDSTWRYSSIWAYLEGSGVAYRMKVENGSITSDNVTILPEGQWDVYLKGENYNENGTLREEKVTNICRFTVAETEDGQRCRFRAIATPTAEEQTKFLALQALDLAKEVMRMAQSEDFKGDTGADGYSPAVSVKTIGSAVFDYSAAYDFDYPPSMQYDVYIFDGYDASPDEVIGKNLLWSGVISSTIANQYVGKYFSEDGIEILGEIAQTVGSACSFYATDGFVQEGHRVTVTDKTHQSGQSFDVMDGADGYTPVRGTDYWTAADIAAIKGYVDDAILGGAW